VGEVSSLSDNMTHETTHNVTGHLVS